MIYNQSHQLLNIYPKKLELIDNVKFMIMICLIMIVKFNLFYK